MALCRYLLSLIFLGSTAISHRAPPWQAVEEYEAYSKTFCEKILTVPAIVSEFATDADYSPQRCIKEIP
jgi:hypothetical protein